MTLSEKYVSGLTLKVLSHVQNKDAAKNCSIDILNMMLERDREWIQWLADNYNISFDEKLLEALYKEAKKAVNSY